MGVGLIALLLMGLGGWLGGLWQEQQSSAGHPQTPQPPFPYSQREVTFSSGGVELAGAVTVPQGDGPFPGVVLLSGAGPQDRDGTLAGHQRYLVLADALTRAGVAVLRYDDRGTGGSGGELLEARFEDLAAEAGAAVELLREQPKIDPGRVGLLGASQGSLVAGLAAREDPRLAFLVLLSPPALPGHEVWVEQQLRVAQAEGAEASDLEVMELLLLTAFELRTADLPEAEKHQSLEQVVENLEQLQAGTGLQLAAGARRRILVQALLSRQMEDALYYDPRPVLEELRLPVLALYGSKDLQVPPSVHAPDLRTALADNPRATVEVIPGLNHLLQPSTTGRPSEYARLEVTLAPKVLERVSRWILDHSHPQDRP
ncbi:MAG: alpha/beta fold hydrolase [Acidobacteriota bacterium]|nr:alpha/beta fold hydrolase [Acidobacteriota bacterium]